MRITPRRILATSACLALACAANGTSTEPALDARQLGAIIPARVFGLGAARGLSAGCTLPEHRQFDFWVGRWDVYAPGPTFAGTNTVELELDGCVIEENWTSGVRGRSINMYDASDGQWHQHWVFAAGGPASVLLLDGASPAPDSMRMGGRRPAPNGAIIGDAITWSAITPDSVRQHWLSTVDDGPPSLSFDGRYKRVAEVTPIPPVHPTLCMNRPANHVLDFLLGRWTISPGNGEKTGMRQGAATVTFSADLDHCLIEEKVDGPGTYRGWSFSGYQPVLGVWKKTYVDNLGQRILLTGGQAGDVIVLTGSKRAADGELLVRVTYAPSGEDRVTQAWETSRDGGTTWSRELEVQFIRAPD
jgi:hypothetical protein